MKLCQTKLKLLNEWIVTVKNAEKQWNALCSLMGCGFEGAFMDAQCMLSEKYTEAISELVGDKGEWLNYYRFECKYGDKPLTVILKDKDTQKETKISLDSLEKLLSLIQYE
jgi:hypothetical protein